MDGNAVTRTTTSNANGFYLFTNLPAGMAYKVTFSLPSGYTYTTPNQGSEALDSDALPNMNGMTNTFVLLSGMANLDIDAGYCPIPDPCNIQLPTSITQGPCQSANDVSTYLLTFTAPVIANGCGQYQVLLDGQLVFTGSNGVGSVFTRLCGEPDPAARGAL
jgi:hypothetical protein